MARHFDSGKSTLDYLYTFIGVAVCWQLRLHKCVALSTIEAKYIASIEDGKEMLWLKHLFNESGIKQRDYKIYCDKQSAMYLNENTIHHSWRKHIDIRYYCICNVIEHKNC